MPHFYIPMRSADHLVAKLRPLREPAMRVRVLVETLATGDPHEWVDVLTEIVERAQRRDDPDAIEALESATRAAADPALPYDARRALYEAAADHPSIARLFFVASPTAKLTAKQRAAQLAPERPLRPTSKPLTLGERKSLARTHSREQLLLLSRDPHPAVVAILLENPHLTEADVVRIAAARPAVPESLAIVAAHPRWSVRHPVKRALVLNPLTPLADAIRIATTLRAADLREIAGDASLRGSLREHAAELMSR